MQCVDCGGYRHDGACPPDDKEAPPKLVTHFPKVCPFCGADPGLARMSIVGDRIWYLVGCESDECACNPQVSGFTLADAWAAWDNRAPGMVREQAAELTEEEQAGRGGFR